jgi:predicted TIM-barrel fold metal-dependent hydrolase
MAVQQLIEDDFVFIDSHVHFYDMNHPKLHYAHWQPDEDLPLKELGTRNYLAKDFLYDAKKLGMKKAIHVQAAIGSKDPVEETKWLEEVFLETGIPSAIVGHVDLRSPNAREIIEKHLQYEHFKGIRDFSYGDYLINKDFRKGFKLQEEYGLISSIAVRWEEMEKLADLAKSFPNIIIVLDHAGNPDYRTREYYGNWKNAMSKISKMENIICKISGLGMGDHDWTKDSIAPYVDICMELFGISRTIFATNWPVDSLYSDYAKVINSYKDLTKNLSKDEKEAFFFKNAEAIYKI